MFSLEAMKQRDDDIPDAGEESVQTCGAGFLTERFLQNGTQQFRHRAQICGLDTDGIEGSAGNVELVAEADIDVRDLSLGCRVA